MADWYPALPQPYVQPAAERGIMPLALGAQVGANIANVMGQNQVRQQAIEQAQATQDASKKYAETGDLNAYRAVDPKGAAAISAADQEQALKFWDNYKWMATPDNWGAFRSMALEKFGPKAEGLLPTNYPGPGWIRQKEDFAVAANKQMSQYQAADIDRKRVYDTARIGDMNTRAGLLAAKTNAYIANVQNLIQNRGLDTQIKAGRISQAELDKSIMKDYMGRHPEATMEQAAEVVAKIKALSRPQMDPLGALGLGGNRQPSAPAAPAAPANKGGGSGGADPMSMLPPASSYTGKVQGVRNKVTGEVMKFKSDGTTWKRVTDDGGVPDAVKEKLIAGDVDAALDAFE